jgi:hypothetical protein
MFFMHQIEMRIFRREPHTYFSCKVLVQRLSGFRGEYKNVKSLRTNRWMKVMGKAHMKLFLNCQMILYYQYMCRWQPCGWFNDLMNTFVSRWQSWCCSRNITNTCVSLQIMYMCIKMTTLSLFPQSYEYMYIMMTILWFFQRSYKYMCRDVEILKCATCPQASYLKKVTCPDKILLILFFVFKHLILANTTLLNWTCLYCLLHNCVKFEI